MANNRSSPNFADSSGGDFGFVMQSGQALNGRVDLMSPLQSLNIPAFQQRSVRNDTFTSEATYGQVAPNDVSQLFFSENNIDALQSGIRYRVYVETNGQYVIGRQSDQELKIVMRSMFYQHSKNLHTDIVSQVKALNAKVLEWVIPEVLSNIKQHEVFKRDASTLPLPMERSPLMTTKGSKTLEIKSFL